ncbi:MAG: hypothetical protein IJB58_00805 [Bacteroidales bacterium]|nr:hypothetical protein [Bacteroidales bacterium]
MFAFINEWLNFENNCLCAKLLDHIAAFVPIYLYDETRGFAKGAAAKYTFYPFYTLHLLLLYLIGG